MSAAKHTPGPWHWPHDSNRLEPVNPDPTRSHVSSILDADGGYGWLGSPNEATLAELEADRRLIQAAPDLLEALTYALKDMQQVRDSEAGNRLAISIGMAREAISKAIGEQP